MESHLETYLMDVTHCTEHCICFMHWVKLSELNEQTYVLVGLDKKIILINVYEH